MTYGKRTCLQCGQEFTASYIAQLCCTPECQKRRRQNRKNAWAKHYRAARRDILERLQEALASAQKEAADSTEALTAVTLMYRAEQRRLQAAVKRLALRRRYLEGRQKELVAQVMKQGEEINCLRGSMERYAKDAFLRAGRKEEIVRNSGSDNKEKKRGRKEKEPTVVPHEEMDEILRGEAGIPPKKALYKKLRAAAKAPINSEMQVCERMSCAALRLPCGEREECFTPRCERVPAGAEWKAWNDKGGKL